MNSPTDLRRDLIRVVLTQTVCGSLLLAQAQQASVPAAAGSSRVNVAPTLNTSTLGQASEVGQWLTARGLSPWCSAFTDLLGCTSLADLRSVAASDDNIAEVLSCLSEARPPLKLVQKQQLRQALQAERSCPTASSVAAVTASAPAYMSSTTASPEPCLMAPSVDGLLVADSSSSGAQNAKLQLTPSSVTRGAAVTSGGLQPGGKPVVDAVVQNVSAPAATGDTAQVSHSKRA